jgi:hypothetical protein
MLAYRLVYKPNTAIKVDKFQKDKRLEWVDVRPPDQSYEEFVHHSDQSKARDQK